MNTLNRKHNTLAALYIAAAIVAVIAVYLDPATDVLSNTTLETPCAVGDVVITKDAKAPSGERIQLYMCETPERWVRQEGEPPVYHSDYSDAQCRAPLDGEIRGTFDWCREGHCSSRCSVMPLDENASAASNNASVKRQAFRL